MKKFLDKFVDGCVAMVNKYLPDAFIFAALLTFVVFIFAVIVMFTYDKPMLNIKEKEATSIFGKFAAIIYNGWYGGFWSLLGFTMEMALIVVTGTIFANTPQMKKAMKWMAGLPKTPGQAVFFEAFFSIFVAFFQWGASLVMSAILAKNIAKVLPGVHFSLLVAAGYLGLGMWHGGFSGSIPLKLATKMAENDAVVKAGYTAVIIPFKYTLFSPFNLFNYVGGMIVLSFVMMAMHPHGDKVVVCDPANLVEEEIAVEKHEGKLAPNDYLNQASWISYGLCFFGLVSTIVYIIKLIDKPFTLDLDFVNFVFLFIALGLHGSPIKVVKAVEESAAGAAGVMLQFPFYGGISGLMTYSGGVAANDSLAEIINNFFSSISNTTTYPLFVFLSAGIINFFIPSGGGQWAVQGPIVMPGAQQQATTLHWTHGVLGDGGAFPADYNATTQYATFATDAEVRYAKYMGKSAMAIAWGDCWTNLIQPFWALPLLAVAKLEAKDIMGYCILALIVLGVWLVIGFVIPW